MKPKVFIVSALFVFTLSTIFYANPFNVEAGWPTKPNINLPVCTADDDQDRPRIVSDGNGGAIIAWQESQGGGE